MQSDTHNFQHNSAKEVTGSSQLAAQVSAPNRLARRSFLRNLGLGAALLAPGAALLSGSGKAWAKDGNEKEKNALTRGDVAILQLLAAAELIETDLWKQYNELGGVKAPQIQAMRLAWLSLMAISPSISPTTPTMRSVTRLS